MDAPSHTHQTKHSSAKKWRNKIFSALQIRPKSKAMLLEVMSEAEKNSLIGPESRLMMEGVLRISEMRALDIMVAGPRIDMIDIEMERDELFHQVIDIGHSRYPVFEENRENIIGVLHSKDLLKLQRAPDFHIKGLLRNALYVPESKSLVDLLREFKKSRNHLALVVDEFGKIAGLVTLEDVLEEIVGEIEDEFDTETSSTDIYTLADKSYRIAGNCSITELNKAFETNLLQDMEEEFDTIGGLIAHEIGHVPQKGESITIAGLRFEVLHAKGGSVKWFRLRL
ncbi:MAG: CBS domain-containing protein [Burkholderiaceae bacterium]|nr:CBS domain-containing protein [Burkholderiaceae bacterium]